ncbi:MAG: RuBisCO large subunit C-terminal-like domain-containing protein [Caldiserica bacterium]|nr:RuBisCO large subunit C-terminal-like domain-containing protein [Caldisericota bacterium]MDH7562703.1 RuBisCO large subunit C-terminal-like domain-containing protein [Caldisericota bacterium]
MKDFEERNPLNWLFLPESVSKDDNVVATYVLETSPDTDILSKSFAIAVEQSTGTWIEVPAETPELRKHHMAKVIGIYELPFVEDTPPTDFRHFLIKIAFPLVNFGAQFPMLLTTVVGNISSAGKIKLVDLEFPLDFLKSMPGPKFGIQGIRDLLGVYDRPLLNNMIKPCTGFPPEVGAKLFYEVASGGVDIVKDDELLANPPFNPIEKRVKSYMEMAKRVYEETGNKVLYTVNITDEPDKLIENAYKAIEAGANALMINFLTAGFSSLKALAENKDINVPILGHPDFGGAISSSPWHGIGSPLLLGKFPRIAGADLIILLSPYGKFPVLRDRYLQTARAMTSPLETIKQTFPMPAGGMYPGIVEATLKDLGTDCIISAGGAIHGHPMGPRAGAKALRQAIEAYMNGIPIEEAGKEHPELNSALKAWGYWKGGERKLFDLL